MAYEKCPRCELNYILDGGNLCTVCKKEVCGETELDDMPELCSECGEHPAVVGGELCAACLKELTRRTPVDVIEDDVLVEDRALEIESVADMDEIEIDIVDDELEGEFAEDEDFDDDVEEEEGDLPLEAEADILDEDDYSDGNQSDR